MICGGANPSRGPAGPRASIQAQILATALRSGPAGVPPQLRCQSRVKSEWDPFDSTQFQTNSNSAVSGQPKSLPKEFILWGEHGGAESTQSRPQHKTVFWQTQESILHSKVILTPNAGGYTILKPEDGRDEVRCESFVAVPPKSLSSGSGLLSKRNFGTRGCQVMFWLWKTRVPFFVGCQNRIHYRFAFEVQMLQSIQRV
ncbi:Hypothetical_protein [Hexamita inflata]|uniref:Hypothetical_protein n=1 Tax=Hexamita inflata TaxID=28002 RepID=A0AA86U3Z5_9EUKA|nr:Hypothetical protein HINF_LOCUS24752 [Hexamita inflata]